MKKLIRTAAAILMAGAAATLAGCAGCSGCSGCNSNTKNIALTSSNWYTGTSYKGIQPSFVYGENSDYTKEEIVYEVTHDGTKSNSTYYVEYDEGEYTTEFYATEYDWNDNEVYPEDKTELLYYYRTELSIKVRYTLKSDNSQTEWFSDGIVSESYFRAAGKNLQPVYSSQKIKSTSPATLQASSLAGTYEKVDVSYENFYNYACTEVKSIEIKNTENGEEKSEKVFTKLNKIDNSLFDNAYLYTAVRSMKLSGDLSQTINLFSAAAGGISTYSVKGGNEQLSGAQRKAFSAELAANGLYTPVTEDANGNAVEDAGISTVSVDLNFTGGELQGTTQRLWFAALENSDNNTARCTLLKISTPLSYSLGTLEYNLKEIKSTLWNK